MVESKHELEALAALPIMLYARRLASMTNHKIALCFARTECRSKVMSNWAPERIRGPL